MLVMTQTLEDGQLDCSYMTVVGYNCNHSTAWGREHACWFFSCQLTPMLDQLVCMIISPAGSAYDLLQDIIKTACQIINQYISI